MPDPAHFSPAHSRRLRFFAHVLHLLGALFTQHALAQEARTGNDIAQLPAISVTGREISDLTEGTNAYTTEAMSTATGLTLSPRETPQSVSVVTRQQIEDQGLTDTGAILATAPGISVTRSDSNRYSFSARGFTIDNFQFDGLVSPILSQWNYGSTDMDAAIYDHVEIVRGATGLMTGSGNPSAAVNFVRKRPLREFAATFNASVGSWDYVRGDADISVPITEDGRIRSRLVAAYSQGDSYVHFLDTRRRTFYGVVSADLTPDTVLTTSVEYQHNHSNGFGSGFPLFYSDGSRTDFNRSVANNAPWARQDTEATTYFVDLTHRFTNDWKLRAAYSHTDGRYLMKHVYRGGYPDRHTGIIAAPPAFSNYDGNLDRDDIHFSLSAPFEAFGLRHEVALGWMSIDNHSDIQRYAMVGPAPAIGSFFDWRRAHIQEPSWADTLSPADDVRTKQTGAYLVGRFALAEPLHLIVGDRWSDWKTKQMYFGSRREYRIKNQFTPYAGLTYDINDTYTAYASYTEIFQPQNARDTSGGILPPIKSKSYELGLKAAYLEGRLNTSAALFQTRQDNLAQVIPGSSIPGFPNMQASRAASGAKVEGIDLEASGQILPDWNIGASYTHFTTKDASGNPINTNHPRSLFKLYTTYRLPGALHRLTVGGGVDWQSRMYQAAASPRGNVEVEQDSYALVSLMARFDFNKKLSATLNVNNLFDKKYYDQIGFYSQGWWGAPRNVMLNLRAQY
ncbi:ferric alcaligin siderophore receptor [Bordetella pertussis]|uniref:Ferric alcaligin siderophore receptor n=2 Tax=Bordetella pertussis TaxID=520 RepID=Q79GM9_BORPE|nr:TonB-dependent alcaligin siderophore receptor FauA [Bordetella pertussis]ETH37653.1 TonB-dependent siderophore receptor [Bordetella pertussis H918]ETH47076.1 TonB-dependent siderophore receptor [Bordetella pertussis H921]ETH82716.1 TonB-dependent siderophore receptor [Bordetella pertussis STO1-CHOC-0017]ETH89793.1 TonB-dependent siderophore receptor [Bordetella pertussis STO1-CHOC-0019]ETH98685.1 TonB-dependent siderophore receptor [Bordetella pertussis STO1-CHOM-0012]